MARKKMLKKIEGFDEWLRFEYCDNHKTMSQIAEEIGCSSPTVLGHLRRCGIDTRKSSDYPSSDLVIEKCRNLGKSRKGYHLSESQKEAISLANRGKRKRNDYEFGGHEKKRADGYIKVYVPDHPYASADGYVMKHRLVMERNIGRYLSEDEVVHHINNTRDDNRIENLKLMTKHEHMSMHMIERHSKGV